MPVLPLNQRAFSDRCNDLFRVPEQIAIGEADMKLWLKLIRAGGAEERKAIRLIMIWVDVTLWRGHWQEVDTYKVSTVRMSCSTMHKLGHRDLNPDDFQDRDLDEDEVDRAYLAKLNRLGKEYRDHKDLETLIRLKHRLPEGYLQKATYLMSYENAINMYRQRCKHRLPDWSGPSGICAWIKSLPYMDKFLEALPPQHTDAEGVLGSLTNEQRVALLGKYCRGCGAVIGDCRCEH